MHGPHTAVKADIPKPCGVRSKVYHCAKAYVNSRASSVGIGVSGSVWLSVGCSRMPLRLYCRMKSEMQKRTAGQVVLGCVLPAYKAGLRSRQ